MIVSIMIDLGQDVLREEEDDSSVLSAESICLHNKRLCYIGQDIRRIPPIFFKLYGTKIEALDMSFNCLSNLTHIEKFVFLKELILDNNEIGDNVVFPYMPHLCILSLNNNCITDLEGFISKLKPNAPNLSFLSLLGNKACPNQLSDVTKDEDDYKRYRIVLTKMDNRLNEEKLRNIAKFVDTNILMRNENWSLKVVMEAPEIEKRENFNRNIYLYYVLHHLRRLKFLDSSSIKNGERNEAAIRGPYMQIKRPKEDEDDTFTSAEFNLYDRYSPLPMTVRTARDHKGAYGKCNFKYSGVRSEGNRFIVNSDL